MLEKIHIVGCGTIGSNLAISIAQHNLCEEIHLHDFDVINRESEYNVFPYRGKCLGLYKTQVVKDYINCIFDDIRVSTYETKIDKPLSGGYVIDCRDRKDNNIDADVRLSLDNHILIIDTLKDNVEFDFSSYCLVREAKYIMAAMSIILNFIQSHLMKTQMKIMYDLDDVFVDYVVIPKGE